MKRTSSTTHQRRLVYLDWLRVLVVLGVFFAHSIDVLDLVNWRIKYQEQSVGIMIATNFAAQWGMALMFLLAGVTAWFALGSRNGPQFINERFKRLLIPSLFGMLLLSPVEAYFEDLQRSLYHGPFLQFVPQFFANVQFGWDLRSLAAFGYHLWFLVFLFLLSFLTLPLLLFLRHKQGLRFIHWVAEHCIQPNGLLLLAIPFVLIQLLLKAPFPGYQNWADCFTWLISFLCGYILFADPRFEQAIMSQKWVLLLVSSACLFLLTVFYSTGYAARWEALPEFSLGYSFYQVLRGLLNWSLLACILAMAIHLLDFRNKLLSYLTEAVLPFYILHFPVVVIMAFSIGHWSDNPLARFLLVSTFSLIVTLALYELLIRRIPMMRWLFGMKPPQPENSLTQLEVEHVGYP